MITSSDHQSARPLGVVVSNNESRQAATGLLMRRLANTLDENSGLVRHNFKDRKLELFVWSRRGAMVGYELHYAIGAPGEWAIRWAADTGTAFYCVDYGAQKSPAGATMVPIEITVARRTLPVHDLHAEFAMRSRAIEDQFRNFVLKHLSQVTRRLPT